MTARPLAAALGGEVLLVDADANLATAIGFVLGKEGVPHRRAASGREGLELARRQPPAVILLDLLLPDLDGYQFCAELKRDPLFAKTRVVFLSALGQTLDVSRGRAAGADGFLAKPFTPAALLSYLRRLGQQEQAGG